MSNLLPDFKLILGLSEEVDAELDEKLKWILESVKSRLLVLLGGIDPGTDLDYIVIETAVVRYNRIGSEGYQAHEVEGENIDFYESDFAPYMSDIQAYIDSKYKDRASGVVRFL